MNKIRIIMNMVSKEFEIKKPKLIVFGAGENGINISNILKKNEVKIDYFCDNDRSKHNKYINNIRCISLEELKLKKEESIVLVSPYNDKEIRDILRANNINNVVSKDLMSILKTVLFSNIKEGYYEFLPHIGHYYSLYPNLDDVINNEKSLFREDIEIKDINLNENGQLEVLRKMINLYKDLPQWNNMVSVDKSKLRYKIGNSRFPLGDAVGLNTMLRILKPNKLIEVGSGYSSAVILDTNEFYLENSIELTFIEPYPKFLKAVSKESDTIVLYENKLQDIPVEQFEQLNKGDVLFIDSTHVSKVGSDVNYLFFEILPKLKKGVYIHLHDIFYPFEYPKEWIYKGQVWNELYLLRAFLQNNKDYTITYFQNMMDKKYYDLILEKWPYTQKPYGGSIWFVKN